MDPADFSPACFPIEINDRSLLVMTIKAVLVYAKDKSQLKSVITRLCDLYQTNLRVLRTAQLQLSVHAC